MTNAAPNADALAKAFELGAMRSPVYDTPDGGYAVLVPPGYDLETVPPLDRPLTHIHQTTTLLDMDSFNDYVVHFKTPATRIFAVPGYLNSGIAQFRAAMDFHETSDKAGYGHHNAIYQPPYSEEWKRWTKAGVMKQAEFAEFIEENRRDIVTPDAANLLDLVRRFKATKKQDYDSLVYQPDGSTAINWVDKTTSATGVIPVPETLKLGIPVFFQGARYEINVFMRYKLTEGILAFTIKVDRPDYAEQTAFDVIKNEIANATGLRVYLGKA